MHIDTGAAAERKQSHKQLLVASPNPNPNRRERRLIDESTRLELNRVDSSDRSAIIIIKSDSNRIQSSRSEDNITTGGCWYSARFHRSEVIYKFNLNAQYPATAL